MNLNHSKNSIFRIGRNVWQISTADKFAILIDGQNYFRELYHVLLQAQQQILITGWDIHSAMKLQPDQKSEQNSRNLHQLINDLVKQRPNLQVYILAWDYSTLIYSMERELLQTIKFGWMSHSRIHFMFDAQHPFGASHHQKLVIIDQAVAFCGGFDLTIRRWDTSDHDADHPARVDHKDAAYQPFHDIQVAAKGECAARLGEIFYDRWEKATGQVMTPVRQSAMDYSFSSQIECSLVAQRVKVGISQTRPSIRLSPEQREVHQLYLDMIRAAESYIYIENQYLTASSIVNALSEVLKRENPPDIVIVLPEKAGGWLEEYTMGLIQNAALKQLEDADHAGKLGVFFLGDQRLESDHYITVHSKLMVIDGVYARIGSSNLNHRSMGLDTECDLVLEAIDRLDIQTMIEFLLARLLAEHTGQKTDEVKAIIKEAPTLLNAVHLIREKAGPKNLMPLRYRLKSAELGRSLADAELLDMEHPAKVEESLDQWAYIDQSLFHKETFFKRHFRIGITVAVALLFAVIVTVSPVKEWLQPGQWTNLARTIGSPLYLAMIGLVIFMISGFILIPLNLLIIVTASIFPTWQSLLLIMVGTLGSAISGYGVGRLLKGSFFERHLGHRVQSILDKIRNGGLLSIIFVRIVPVAPHALINLTAGFSRIKFSEFVIGTLIGAIPGSVTLVFFQKSLIDVFTNFSIEATLTSAGLLFLMGILFYVIRTRFSRYVERSS